MSLCLWAAVSASRKILHPSKGASIYYVRKIFGILEPLPPCSLFGLNHKTKFTQPRLLRSLLGTLPPPPLCERHKWIAPYRGYLILRLRWGMSKLFIILLFQGFWRHSAQKLEMVGEIIRLKLTRTWVNHGGAIRPTKIKHSPYMGPLVTARQKNPYSDSNASDADANVFFQGKNLRFWI